MSTTAKAALAALVAGVALAGSIGPGQALTQPQRQYLIYFKRQTATPQSDANDVVDRAVHGIAYVEAVRVDVVGHCDLYEKLFTADGHRAPPSHCDRLALQRARAVAAMLRARELPASVEVRTSSIADKAPAVPQRQPQPGEDVGTWGEPLNRFVEIAF